MAEEHVQENQYVSISTPFGENVLLVHGFEGEEGLSRPFQFTLKVVSLDDSLDPGSILGSGVTVIITLADGSQRYLHGIATRFVQAGSDRRFTTYYLDVRPWLWLLTLTSDSRIFQNQTAPQIIEAVFRKLGFTDYKNALSHTYQPREYCVQYMETSFEFVSRLMEDEGIFYFFEHMEDRHTLVLADDAGSHKPCPGMEAAAYRSLTPDWPEEDVITACTIEQQVTSTEYAMDDFNFEIPSTDLNVFIEGHTIGNLSLYEYPGGFMKKDAGESRAKVRMEEHELPAKQLRGQSNCRSFMAGYQFEMVGHPRSDANATYVLRKVTHNSTLREYSNSFEAFPTEVPFRPPHRTAKPRIVGAQTAIVVGKSGEEIWTDKYGRVKVQFHWDRLGQRNENSSCWIRVAQGWAGKSWGGFFLPRIGQEVVVSFLEGDPDRPLITGAVYNAEQVVPYPLPDEQTKSTVKSNSSKGGGGFNEIRFEDRKDAEEIFVHAQKDMQITVENDRVKDVMNNETNTIQQNRTTTIQEADETLIVSKGNRTVQVDTGNETHEVKGKRSITVTGNENHSNKANFVHEVSGNFTLKVSGNITIQAGGSITAKAGTSFTNKAGMSLTNEAGTTLTNKANVSLTNEAGVSLTNKGSASQTVDGGGMLVLKGGLVKIN